MKQEAKKIYLKDYTKPDFTITEVELYFDLYEEQTLVSSKLHLRRQKSEAKEIVLDAQELELLEIKCNSRLLTQDEYAIQEEQLVIFDAPQEAVIEIKNRIYPQKNTELEGLYKSGGIFCTQCEPEGFRRITPYIDRPDVMAVFTVTIEAEKERYPLLLSNGNKVKCHENFTSRHALTWHDPHPKPSYLFALVAGDLGVVSDTFTTMHNREVALNIYCDKGNESQCHHALKALKDAMVWDEKKYGRAYDLDIYNIVAVDSFNMGAMENKGLNIFNSAYVLADTATATDANFMAIESVIAHEYFHNWTGNRITCRDWFQLTLKEGLTVFRDQSFSGDMNSPSLQRIEDVKALRERQFVEDASATRHPIQPKFYISMNNFYTATVYEKGAEVIGMLHTFLGAKRFREAMDLYFETFDGQAVTTDDFLWAMHQKGDFDLDAFRLWYDQSGTPRLSVREAYSDGVYTLTLTQKIPDAADGSRQKPMYYPLKIALYSADGKELVREMLRLKDEEESFEFKLEAMPKLSINRDFSAPIIVEYEQSDDAFLMEYDTNSFTKYEAAQRFAISTLESLMRGGGVNERYLHAYEKILKSDMEEAYKALLLELPSVSVLMQRQEEHDCFPIYEALQTLSNAIAVRFEKDLRELYLTHHNPINSALDAKSQGDRALKNRALKILSAHNDKSIAANLAIKQYRESVTMTDTIAALDVLEHTDELLAKEAFKDFYEKYHTNTLVMNKYFALLASSMQENVLSRVEALQNDKAYDVKVPNLVRSLVGSFARNHKHFHAKDGSGYRFIADKILEIDKINPQMASGLCLNFRNLSKLNKESQKMMKRELMRVVSTQQLSKNSFEILDKILNESEK